MKKIALRFIKSIFVILCMTSACFSAFSQSCLCTNQSLVDTYVSTSFGGGPVVNNWVGSYVEMVGVGSILGHPGAKWDINFSSNIIRIRFAQSGTASYSAGAAFTFSNLNPKLQGCTGAIINSITVTTDHSTTMFNVINAASFGPHSVTVPIASIGGPASTWLSGEFIQIQLNYACEPTCNVNMCVSPTNGTSTATSLNFGSVTAGLTPAASPVRTVTITNCAPMGGANLYVSPGTIASATRYSFFPDPGPAQAQYTIPPTQSKNFKVRFNPLVAGTSNASWNIYYNANSGSTSNPYVVNLTGTSPPIICDGTVVQGPILCDFGNVTVGTTVYKTILVQNKATSCNDLTFTPGTLSAPYSFITSASYSKVPGDQETFIVAFSPTAVTTYPTQIWNMTNNSTNRSNPYGITVTGTGVAANICSPILMTGPVNTNFSAIAVNTGVTISSSESKTILIKNTSTTCVLNVTWSPGPVGPFSVDHYSASINPGNTEPFVVTFAPTNTGIGTLDGTNSNWRTWNITHNATNQIAVNAPVFHLKLKGTGL